MQACPTKFSMTHTTRSTFSGFENTFRAEIFHIEFSRTDSLGGFILDCLHTQIRSVPPLFSLSENTFSNSMSFGLFCLVGQYPYPN